MQPWLTFVQPVTGFQVASVHSIEEFALKEETHYGMLPTLESLRSRVCGRATTGEVSVLPGSSFMAEGEFELAGC